MAVDIRFIIDGVDRGQPLNPNDFSININEEISINTRITSFNNDLLFSGDVYSYLYQKLKIGDACALSEVVVQYYCNSNWKELVKGYFVISECQFDLEKCLVKTKLYDRIFSTKINNNKSIKFSTAATVTKNLIPITAPRVIMCDVFNPANGTYYTQKANVTSVYLVFEHLVRCMSDDLVDFASNFFFNRAENVSPLPKYDGLFVSNGKALSTKSNVETMISFQDLFNALNKKFRLGIGFEVQTNGRPLLRIEEADYFFEQNSNIYFIDQPNITLQYETAELYAGIALGCSEYYNQNECNNGDGGCQFAQLTYYGFKEESFGLIGECNTGVTLDIVSNEVIFDPNIIEDCVRFGNESFNDNPFIITCQYSRLFAPVTYFASAQKFDPYNIGQTIYNGELNNENVLSNWINGYPQSVYNYISGFSPSLTNVTSYLSPPPLQAFGAIDSEYTRFSEFFGYYIIWGQTTNDPGSNFINGRDYIVPYNGIYTVNVFTWAFSTLGISNGAIIINHRSPNESTYNDYFGTYQNFDANQGVGEGFFSVNKTFVASQGDKISIDFIAKAVSGATNTIVNIDNFNAQTQNPQLQLSMLTISGEPLQPTVLQPYDPNDYKKFVYKFTRKLTMDEITTVINNPSLPIFLNYRDDNYSTIKTYIKNIDIKSIVTQSADVQLKSNKVL
jgi:hypothetical protein